MSFLSKADKMKYDMDRTASKIDKLKETYTKNYEKLKEIENGNDDQPKFSINADDMEILRQAKMQLKVQHF